MAFQDEQILQWLGKRLAEPVMTANGTVLIGEGTVLTREHLVKMGNFGIDLYDLVVSEEPVEQPASPEQWKEQLLDLSERNLEKVYETIRLQDEVPMEQLEREIIPMMEEIWMESNFYGIFSKMKNQEGLYRHSIGVSVLVRQMAKWLRLDEADSELLAKAALLYDIGMVLLPEPLIAHPGDYTEEEREQMKQHTVLGHQLLKQSGQPEIAEIALQHHERLDGSGYPHGLKGQEISELAQIIAIADVFMAMISERPNREALPVNRVLQHLQEEMHNNRFSPDLVVPFVHHMMSAQLGKDCVLTNGERGRICHIPPELPLRPLIMGENGQIIDLKVEKELDIYSILG